MATQDQQTVMSSDAIRATPGLQKSDILFTAGTTIRINAPASHVFSVITDFAQYHAWNRDTPSMAPQTKNPSAAATDAPTIQKGTKLDMKITMTEQNRNYDVPIEILRYENSVDTNVFALAWRGNLMPSWLATSERVQEVRPDPSDDSCCEVDNFESMAGWGAYALKYLMGIQGQMTTFNERYLEDLKKRAEGTWNQQQTRS